MAKSAECPNCQAQSTRVTTTRYHKKMRVVKRYCYCPACNSSFVTVEIGIVKYLQLIKSGKLLDAIKKSVCE